MTPAEFRFHLLEFMLWYCTCGGKLTLCPECRTTVCNRCCHPHECGKDDL